MTQTIQEVFKQFCKERHTEDKGKNHDLLQEIYASTEFFDTTLYEFTGVPLINFMHKDNTYMVNFPIKDFALPFQNVFVRISDTNFLFIREYAPNTITGTLYTTDYM